MNALRGAAGLAAIGVFVVAPLWATNVFGETPDNHAYGALAMTLGGIAWVFALGWFSAHGNHKVLIVLGCAFLAFAPLFRWYWLETAADRAIALETRYKGGLEMWSGYKDSDSPSEWKDWNQHLRNSLVIAKAQSSEAFLEKKKRRTWLYLAGSGIGTLFAIVAALDALDVFERTRRTDDRSNL